MTIEHAEDFENLLRLDYQPITGLAGIEAATYLAELHLHRNDVVDLTPLAGLKQLIDS